LFQKISNFSKKAKKFQKKSQNLTKTQILEKFGFFGFILAFLEIFVFHVAYIGIGGTYRVQKSDVDDSVEGTEKAFK
jgi:hypothetical protein